MNPIQRFCIFALLTFFSLPSLAEENREFFEVVHLGDSSYAVMSKKFQTMGCNSGFIIGKNGVVVFDTHISQEAMKMVLKEIEKLTAKPVLYAVNSHFHGDHVQGNGALPKTASIIAHKNAVEKFARADTSTAPEKDVRPPDRGIDRDETLKNTSVKLIAIGKAHSIGDLAAYHEKDQVLFLGDVYVNGYIGFLKEAHLREWVSALEKLKPLKVKTVVPGHGPVSTFSGVTDYQKYLADFAATAKAHFDQHKKTEGYQLPKKYDHLGARFFLEGNLNRAFELWKKKEL